LIIRDVAARAFRGLPARATLRILERLFDAPPGGFAVLTYHRVDEPDARPWLYPPLLSATPSRFENQIRDLTGHYRPIGLPDLLAARRGERPLPRRAVLVTFDDGYRDFRANAWPILRRLGVPATLFVPTAFPDGSQPFWWDRVWDALRRTDRKAVETPAGRFELGDPRHRVAAARAIVDSCKRIAHDEAMAEVAMLADSLDVPAAPPDVLGWDDLRQLSAEGLHVAPHSRTHPVMTRVTDNRLVEEIEGSRRDLERELPGTAFGTVFAYPAGQHDERTRAALSRLGVELAFTTERGVNRVGRGDALVLRRVNVGPRSRAEVIRAQLTFYTLRYPAGGA
jgi:peptidoglycan/xylan/chitin deacetylase (PgdA/CDA1 family)